MKLQEIKPLSELQEGFVPGEMMLALHMLADGRSDNIAHRFVLAKVVNYIKDHGITTERFRELNEYQASKECIDAIREMAKPKLAKLAKWAVEKLESAIKGIDQEGYTNPQEELVAFLNKVAPDR